MTVNPPDYSSFISPLAPSQESGNALKATLKGCMNLCNLPLEAHSNNQKIDAKTLSSLLPSELRKASSALNPKLLVPIGAMVITYLAMESHPYNLQDNEKNLHERNVQTMQNAIHFLKQQETE